MLTLHPSPVANSRLTTVAAGLSPLLGSFSAPVFGVILGSFSGPFFGGILSAVSTAACGKGPTRSQFSGPSSVQVLTPISGPRNCRVLSADLQVSGFWEWCLHLRQTAASYGREPIFINIDESSMPQFCKAKRGVCLRRSDWPAGKVPCGPRKPPRNTATLLAMISSEGTLQKCLPQILIGNERCFPRRLLLSAQAASAATTVQYWRRKSSWVNGPVMVQALEELAKALGPLRLSDSKQIVIVWDCCRIHLTEEVLRACKRLHFWVVFVPTHITSLLQPLDTCVFGPLKQRMRRRYAEAMRGSGCVSVAQWLQLLQEVTVTMLSERSWQKSFRSVGISSSAPLSADLQHLGIEYPLPEPGRVLSLTKLLPPGSDSKCELLLNCPRVRFLS